METPFVEESTGQRRAPAYAVDRGIVHRLLNTPPVLVLFKMPQKYALLWHIRPTAAAGGVRHSTVDPSMSSEAKLELFWD